MMQAGTRNQTVAEPKWFQQLKKALRPTPIENVLCLVVLLKLPELPYVLPNN
jgi:hypothetical protein